MTRVRFPKKMPKKKGKPPTTARMVQYQNDPKFRKTIQAENRKRYRQKVNKELSSCLRSLDFYTTLASHERVILPNGEQREWPVFNLPVTAQVLQRYYQTVWRWVRDGTLPAPVLKTTDRRDGVYHSDEVRVMIEILGKHEKKFAYYRRDHAETRAELFSAIRKVRKKLGVK